MTEYIKRDDVQNMLDKAQIITDAEGEYFGYCTEDVDINLIPSADAVEVVRCKDCKYATMTYDGMCKYCYIHSPEESVYYDGDYFCAYGEKSENNG